MQHLQSRQLSVPITMDGKLCHNPLTMDTLHEATPTPLSLVDQADQSMQVVACNVCCHLCESCTLPRQRNVTVEE